MIHTYTSSCPAYFDFTHGANQPIASIIFTQNYITFKIETKCIDKIRQSEKENLTYSQDNSLLFFS